MTSVRHRHDFYYKPTKIKTINQKICNVTCLCFKISRNHSTLLNRTLNKPREKETEREHKLWWWILVGLRLQRQYTHSTNENFHLWLRLSNILFQINKAEKPRQTETMHTFRVRRIQVRLLFIFPIRGQHSKTVKTEMVFLFQKASHEHIQCTQRRDVAVCFPFDTVNITTPLQRQAGNSFRPMVQSTQ
jgi:hypothetical protein